MSAIIHLLTHTGRVRDHNEDRVMTTPIARGDGRHFDLLAVADGMGGHARGEVAAEMALQALVEYLSFGAWDNPMQGLEASFQLANERVHAAGGGMGTTLVAILLDTSGTYWTANVGDSRAYLLSPGHMKPLTQDHSEVAVRVQAGLLTREEADRSQGRNVLLRAIGPDATIEVDVFPPQTLRSGERLLLCSDGLHAMLPEREIARVAGSSKLADVPAALVELANAAGGRDNISVVVAALDAADVTIAEGMILPGAAAAGPRVPVPVLAGVAAAGVLLLAGGVGFFLRSSGGSKTKADAASTVAATASGSGAPGDNGGGVTTPGPDRTRSGIQLPTATAPRPTATQPQQSNAHSGAQNSPATGGGSQPVPTQDRTTTGGSATTPTPPLPAQPPVGTATPFLPTATPTRTPTPSPSPTPTPPTAEPPAGETPVADGNGHDQTPTPKQTARRTSRPSTFRPPSGVSNHVFKLTVGRREFVLEFDW